MYKGSRDHNLAIDTLMKEEAVPKIISIDPEPRVRTITVELERELALALVIICNKIGGPPEGVRGLFSDGKEGTTSLGFILRTALGDEGAWATERLEKNLGFKMRLQGGDLGTIWFHSIK